LQLVARCVARDLEVEHGRLAENVAEEDLRLIVGLAAAHLGRVATACWCRGWGLHVMD